MACVDPESYVRGGPALQLFFDERIQKHYKRAIIGLPMKRH